MPEQWVLLVYDFHHEEWVASIRSFKREEALAQCLGARDFVMRFPVEKWRAPLVLAAMKAEIPKEGNDEPQ